MYVGLFRTLVLRKLNISKTEMVQPRRPRPILCRDMEIVELFHFFPSCSLVVVQDGFYVLQLSKSGKFIEMLE